MVFTWRTRTAVGVLCLCTSGGCDRLPISGLAPQTAQTAAEPSETTTRPRYQLEKDRQGRVIRLDTVTGAITVVEPSSTSTAASGSNRASGPAENTPPPQAGTDARGPAATPPVSVPSPPVPESATAERASAPSPPQAVAALTTGTDVCLRQDVFRDAVTLTSVPVYIQPRELHTPLTTLPSAVMVAAAERAGDWYLIRFDDRRWGPRVGYVHCSSLRALDRQARDEPAR